MSSEIPPEVFSREILTRLPAITLLNLKRVCKSWYDFINDPFFTNLHLKIQSSSHVGFTLILKGHSSLYSLSLQSLSFHENLIVNPKLLNTYHLNRNCVVNLLTESCNGIMLVSVSIKKERALWNPLIGEYHKLPVLTDSDCVISNKSVGLYHSVIGLGYDSISDDYKVVRVGQVFDPRDKSLGSETLVYSLRLGYWRRIKDVPYRISRLRGGVYMKGALHWICKPLMAKCADDWVVVVDLETEEYRLLRLPDVVEKPAKHLGLLGGCLSLSCYYQIDRLDVWLMRDYGDESSWEKLFSVAVGDGIGSAETLRPVFYYRSEGKVLLQHDKKEFIWFDLRTRMSSKIVISGGVSNFSSQIFRGSLVRLNGYNSGMSVDVEVPAKDGKNKVT